MPAGCAIALLAGGCGDDDDLKDPATEQPRTPAAKVDARVQAQFDREDANRDRVVDRREIRGAIERDFRAMDLDRDGYVTARDIEIEVEAGAKKSGRDLPVPKLSDSLPFDRSRDGRITLREYGIHVQRDLVAALDRNRDGSISRPEAR